MFTKTKQFLRRVNNVVITRQYKVSIVGAPLSLGQKKQGVELGPHIIRQYDLISGLRKIGHIVTDTGDINVEIIAEESIEQHSLKQNFSKNISQYCEILHDKVTQLTQNNEIILTLGGDNSIVIGSISAMLKVHPNIRVIWVDAHADINTPSISYSGNIHGMPVAYLMGLCKNSNHFRWLHALQSLPANQFVYIGLRDLDEAEKRNIKELSIKAFTISDIDQLGIKTVIKEALIAIDPENKYPIHLSFDIDVIDRTIVAGTGYPSLGGLTFREARYLCEKVHETGRMISMDMVEVNPVLDQIGTQTGEVATELILSAFGKKML